jgi:hypothetical protein
VRDLVTTQLGGTIAMHTDGGTVVVLTVPINQTDENNDGQYPGSSPLAALEG